MARDIGHVHIKTYEPGDSAALHRQFRRDDEHEAPNGNILLNLHGPQLNVTTISSAQNRLRSNGAHVMLEQVSNGRHVAFIETPKVPRWS